jgi:putative NADH-flavin reductase
MRLTVFGATGRIGRELVVQGLAAGHEVTAVVRDRARVPEGFAVAEGDGGGRLTVFEADPADSESLREAVAGRDAVFSALGARKLSDAGVVTRLTRSVSAAMAAEGTRRLLVVSAAPLAGPPVGGPLYDRVLNSLVGVVFRKLYNDLRVMESELAESGLDWTSVRPPQLVDKPVTGVYRTAVDANPVRSRTIGRADVAHAMLAMVDDVGTVKRGVGVAW